VQVPLTIEWDPLEPECALALVDVSVDGRTYPFVLDTGARRSTIISDEWTRSLPRVGSEMDTGVFESRLNELVHVPRVAVGPIVANDVVMSLTDPDDADADSLLGMDVLGSRALRLDLAGASLEVVETLADGRPLDRDQAGHCFVTVTFGEVTGRACIDTGAAMTVVSRSFFDSHPRLFSAARTSVGQGNGGIAVETPTYRIDGYAVSDTGFGPHVVAVVDLPPQAADTDLILGFPTLSQATWTFDFVANLWTVHS